MAKPKKPVSYFEAKFQIYQTAEYYIQQRYYDNPGGITCGSRLITAACDENCDDGRKDKQWRKRQKQNDQINSRCSIENIAGYFRNKTIRGAIDTFDYGKGSASGADGAASMMR